jgi:hypothetical protein
VALWLSIGVRYEGTGELQCASCTQVYTANGVVNLHCILPATLFQSQQMSQDKRTKSQRPLAYTSTHAAGTLQAYHTERSSGL